MSLLLNLHFNLVYIYNLMKMLNRLSLQSAYLVGIADPESVPGRTGLLDPATIMKSVETIQNACQTLNDTTATQTQVCDTSLFIQITE